MYVKVRDGLSCGLPIVNADVIAGGMMLFLDQGSGLVQQGQEGFALCRRGVEEGSNVAPRQDQEMPGRDWESIMHDEAQSIVDQE
jgi:hypothetical protein